MNTSPLSGYYTSSSAHWDKNRLVLFICKLLTRPTEVHRKWDQERKWWGGVWDERKCRVASSSYVQIGHFDKGGQEC